MTASAGWPFTSCALGALMIVLDVTIVGVALPTIREDLGFSETSLAWVVNAYLLTFGGLLLLGGRLGDLYGHRRLFLYGSRSSRSLAGVRPLDLAGCPVRRERSRARRRDRVGGVAVADHDPVHRAAERAKAMGFFGFVASGGGSSACCSAGIDRFADWHWIFLVNVPIGVVVFALCIRLLPPRGRSERREARRAGGGERDRRPDGRDLRGRQRQRERVDLVRDARAARARRGAVRPFLAIEARVAPR